MKRLLLILGFAMVCAAQNVPFPSGSMVQLFDNNGAPCSGCLLHTYVAGGTTPQTTYQTPAGSANTNPVVLSSAGTANIWTIPGVSYRFDLYSAAAVLIRTIDNVPGGSVLGQSTVTANFVLAGPTTGAGATPTFRALVAADFAGLFAGTTCTNKFLSALDSSLAGTCTSPVIASAQFANQGTTTTVPHGNAAGNPTWGPVVGADFGASIAARTSFGNPSASAAAPGFSTTQDALAYQTAEIPSFVFVASDFTTSGVGTALEAITGLAFTIPASIALNVPFSCHFIYQQGVANVGVAFGLQDATVSPTNINAAGVMHTSTTASTAGVLIALASTTATAIVTATPGATATDYVVDLSGVVEAPSNVSSSVVSFRVSTATAADLVTVRRASWCRFN
jgi:hypothetical protein